MVWKFVPDKGNIETGSCFSIFGFVSRVVEPTGIRRPTWPRVIGIMTYLQCFRAKPYNDLYTGRQRSIVERINGNFSFPHPM